jgi:broad specificity phosphatase PhoE
MPEIVLIRPGCTDFDEQRRIQGVLDLPLNHRGHAQVLGLVAQLQGVEFDVIFSGPSEPARSTALAICEPCGAGLKEVDDFRNLDHGLWQGLQVDDVRRKYPKVFKQWQECPESVCLPEGETVAEAVERIRRGLRKCLKRKRTIGIVASEPLATMIGCVLRGERPSLPETCEGKPQRPTIERFSLPTGELPESPAAPKNGKSALAAAASPAPANGHNGKSAAHGEQNGKGAVNGEQNGSSPVNGTSPAPINGTSAAPVNGRSGAHAKSHKDHERNGDSKVAAGPGTEPLTKRGARE